ncbi:MAG: hypothetical protein JWR69_1783 [Pedosphaera sp.]|nr:hypothetical protein [Pedosphaera sp.]
MQHAIPVFGPPQHSDWFVNLLHKVKRERSFFVGLDCSHRLQRSARRRGHSPNFCLDTNSESPGNSCKTIDVVSRTRKPQIDARIELHIFAEQISQPAVSRGFPGRM